MKFLSVALTLIFVIAKLGGYIAWSWWLVFAPLWVGILISLFLLLTVGSFAVWASKH